MMDDVPPDEPIRPRPKPYVIELTTTAGKVCERFSSYERAKERIERFPPETIVGLPLIFKELPDGSYRAVRADEKPLQFHRIEDEEVADDPLPLTDEEPTGKPIITREPDPDW